MFVPNRAPSEGGGFVFIKLPQHRFIAKDSIYEFQNIWARTPRFIKRCGGELIVCSLVILLLHTIKQARVATAPLVEGLLRVTHAEKTALAAGILHHCINEIGHCAPLNAAGVLKLIEQPMVKRAV